MRGRMPRPSAGIARSEPLPLDAARRCLHRNARHAADAVKEGQIVGIDSTPPQAAEKSNYSADTPSSPIASFRFDNAKRRRQENHPRQRWLTPAYILEPIRQLLGGIELDPCTEPDNPIEADRFYTPPQDGAVLPWDARSVFVNPPYGEARERWVERAIIEGRRRKVVLLIPAATDTFTCQRALGACRS